MTALNKQALREAAEKATPGDWRRASTRFNGITATPFSLGGEEVMLAGTSEKRDAEFIAAANPKVVLAMLDELEAADNNLIDSECHVAELEEALRDKQALLEASEQRIAELESLMEPQLPQTAVVDNDKLRADFERWMVEDEKCIVGSSDPYPAEIESRNWRAWNACRAAMLRGSEPETDNTTQQFESLSRGGK